MDADFAEWDSKDLAERVKLIKRFDRMCDNIRNGMIDILSRSSEETYEVSTISVRRRLVARNMEG